MTVKILALCVFLACTGIGFCLAQKNPLENDEIYSQKSSLQNLGFVDILKGKIDEGNNSPLFYLLQKSFFKFKGFWLEESFQVEQDICNPDAQTIMRTLPVLFMSAAVALIFYFFAARFGLGAGMLALALTLTSPMIWLYWAQARPYGLWVLLGCAQLLLLIDVVGLSRTSARSWAWLALVHVLLCLTTSFGMVQVVIAMVFVWRMVPRQDLVWLLAVPMALGLFYFMHAPRYPFHVTSPTDLIYDNFPLDRLLLLAAAACGVKNHLKLLRIAGALLLVAATIIAYYLTIKGAAGFELSSRYFIFLTPPAIILVLFFWWEFWRRYARQWWPRVYLLEVLAAVLVFGALRTYIVWQRLWV